MSTDQNKIPSIEDARKLERELLTASATIGKLASSQGGVSFGFACFLLAGENPQPIGEMTINEFSRQLSFFVNQCQKSRSLRGLPGGEHDCDQW